MKVWEVAGREVSLKRDTSKMKAVPEEAEMYAKTLAAIEEEWRDNISFWDRCDLNICSKVEDWRCGSFGPEGKVCLRLEGHKGRCSDFFSLADQECLCKMEAQRRKEELDEILGRPLPSTSSGKYDLRKIRKILKSEKH